jgi:ribosomal protein S18 acetylase RimI-like enzyme
MREDLVIQPVRPVDLFAITRMAYANMAGADEDFTRLLSRRFSRWAGYFTLPLYLLFSGQGYKAVSDGSIIGCAFLDLRERSGYVFNVSVNARYRRRGIATELMDHLEHVTRTKKRRWLALHVDKNNLPAWKLYERLGYRTYHPYFMRHERARTGALALPAPAPQVTVEPLRLRKAHDTFRHFATLECSEGDAWVDRVVADEYSLTSLMDGVYWRCWYGREEMGCAWTGASGAETTFFLLLRPAYWGHTATVSVLALLRKRLAPSSGSLNVYVGSSEHLVAAAPLLRPFGFHQATQRRVLMLKLLT